MKTLNLILTILTIFGATCAHAVDCAFREHGRLHGTENPKDDKEQLNHDAQSTARSAAQEACNAAHWSDCETDPKYTMISKVEVENPYSYRIEYEATIVSSDCTSFTSDIDNEKKFEKQGKYYVKLNWEPTYRTQDQEQCEPGGHKKSIVGGG